MQSLIGSLTGAFFISVLPSRSRVVEIIIVLVIAYQEEAVLRPHPLQLLSCSFDQPAVAWSGIFHIDGRPQDYRNIILQIGFTQYIQGDSKQKAYLKLIRINGFFDSPFDYGPLWDFLRRFPRDPLRTSFRPPQSRARFPNPDTGR